MPFGLSLQRLYARFLFAIFLLVSTKIGALAYCFMRKPVGFLRLQRCPGGAATFASLRVKKRFENDAQASPAIFYCLLNRFFGVCGWDLGEWMPCAAMGWAGSAVCLWVAHVCLHDFAYQIGKSPAAPVNTAKYAINSVEICG